MRALGFTESADRIRSNRKGPAMAKKGSGKSRSAITGRYVKNDYAKKHPNTTVTEKGKKKPPQKKN
jgi:hypothetical protein